MRLHSCSRTVFTSGPELTGYYALYISLCPGACLLLQNNLQELHALLSFAVGDVLGTASQFKRIYGAHRAWHAHAAHCMLCQKP